MGKKSKKKQQHIRSVNIGRVYDFFNILATYSITFWLLEKHIYSVVPLLGSIMFLASILCLPVGYLFIEKALYKFINSLDVALQCLVGLLILLALCATIMYQIDEKFGFPGQQTNELNQK